MSKALDYTLHVIIMAAIFTAFLFAGIGIGIMVEREQEKNLNVICTWDIPAEHIGADLPPLPVRKHKN